MHHFVKKLGILLHLFVYCILLSSCTKDQINVQSGLDTQLERQISTFTESGQASYYILPEESDLNSIPQDPENKLTEEKVLLGKLLFFDTGFGLDSKHGSGEATYSCASCHIPEKGFRPNNVQGIADGGIGYGQARRINPDYVESELDVQEARPLSLVNVAYVTNTSWNGSFGMSGSNIGTEGVWSQLEETERNHLGYQGLETQNIQGMITHRIRVNKSLTDEYGYTGMFDVSFPEFVRSQRYSTFTASLAISAYLRTVLSNEAPFQQWLKGDHTAMTQQEKEGALLFFGKAACTNCHYKKNLGSDEFHALGVKDMDQNPRSLKSNNPTARRNLGRGGFTLDTKDNYKFKVPGIYNIGDSDHFFHGSSVTTLEELIDYKNNAVKENDRVDGDYMSKKFVPLYLDDKEKKQLVAFVRNALRDPDLLRYQPDQVLSGNCFPNNDKPSVDALGCQ